MANVKVKTHTTYTYETTDGREFDDQPAAERWQTVLDTATKFTMLDSSLKKTTDICRAIYVYLKDQEQFEAFAVLQEYEGICSRITEPGYWYYDDRIDGYIDIVKERAKLYGIIEALNAQVK